MLDIPVNTLTWRFGKLLTKKRAERKYNILSFFFRVYKEICGLYKTRFLEAYTHISIRNRPGSPYCVRHIRQNLKYILPCYSLYLTVGHSKLF